MTAGISAHFENICSHKRDENIIEGVRGFLKGEKTILDVGCGNGRLAKKLQEKLGLEISGIDVYLPEKPKIPVSLFDGKKIPFSDNSFDAVFLMDMLHHAENAFDIFSEAMRVAKKFVLIKDHFYENAVDSAALKIADFAGNFASGMPLTFNFKSKKEWREMLAGFAINEIEWRSMLFPGITFPQVIYMVRKN